MTNDIGLRIKQLRLEKSLTQMELAKLLGCAQNTIAEWEKRENRSPGKELLKKLSNILEVPTDYILEGKIDTPGIPHYGDVNSESFNWSKFDRVKRTLSIPKEHCQKNLYSLKITDDLLEPTICQNDYAIFKKKHPQDGDIVIIRFIKTNRVIIRLWRQKGRNVVITETKLSKICPPYFVKITKSEKDSVTCKNKKGEYFVSEGVLVLVKKNYSPKSCLKKVNYI